MNNHIKEVVGFDLGHGETSLCRVDLSSDKAPRIIELYPNQKTVTSAIAHHNGKLLFGSTAVRKPDATMLHIAFKQRPQPGNPTDKHAHMLQFIAAIRENLVNSQQIDLLTNTLAKMTAHLSFNNRTPVR